MASTNRSAAPDLNAPLSFEDQSYPVTADSDMDDLQSEDELDVSAAAAMRQRIERLAESYLQGKPLFIMSAALKGPFDSGWVNPWRKNRQRKCVPRKVRKVVDGPVVPESEPRTGSVDARRTATGQLGLVHAGKIECNVQRCGCTQVTGEDNRSWLKTARIRNRPGIFDLPTSPSESVAKGRGDLGGQRKSNPPPANDSASCSLQQHNRPESINPTHRTSPSEPVVQEPAAVKVEPSSYIVDSSSHLPKFEYRLLRDDATDNRRLAHDDVVCSTKDHTADNTYPGTTTNYHSNASISEDPNLSDGRSHAQENEDPSTASGTFPSSEKMTAESDSSGPVESIPVEANPQRIRSDGNPSPEAPFSTQAAVLLAQISFQNDLESPVKNSPTRPEDRRASPRTSSSELPHPTAITPFSKANVHGRSPRTVGEDSQVISTQRMIEEVTACAPSTEGKRARPATSTRDTSASDGKKKPKTLSFALSSPEQIQEAAEKPENVNFPPVNANELKQEADGNDDQEGTQQTTLQLTLTGSTPPTAQRANREMSSTSSNLNEVIVDAGSWLQDGWDLNKGSRSFDTTVASTSSAA